MDLGWDAPLFGMSKLELFAALLGLVSVWLTVVQNVWCWPVGAVMVALYFFIFYQARLYADMGLQGVYFVLQFYGWYAWLYGGARHDPLTVRRATPHQLVMAGALGLAGTFALGHALSRYTDASLPYWDSAATAFSLVAQWLLARKLIENWLLWVGVDVLSVGIYWVKGLYPTMVLYAVFTGMAVCGYRAWLTSCPPRTPA